MGLKLDQIIETFKSVDPLMRVELLLDYARRLPPLAHRYHAQRDAGLYDVPECQTPVFLVIELGPDGVQIHVEVAEEAPTVKGFISILVDALTGVPPQEVAHLPLDLIHRMGLDDLIRMNRAVGLTAILARIKSGAAAA